VTTDFTAARAEDVLGTLVEIWRIVLDRYVAFLELIATYDAANDAARLR